MRRLARAWQLAVMTFVATACSSPQPTPIPRPTPIVSTTPAPTARPADLIAKPVRARLGAADAPLLPVCDAGLAPSFGEPQPASPARPGRIDLAIVGQMGGPVRSATISGDRLFLGVGPRVLNFDLAASLRQVAGSAVLAGPVHGLATSGETLVAALGTAGIAVLEEGDGQLAKAADLAMPGSAVAVAINGHVAYVAASLAGLRIVDLTDPARPIELAPLLGLHSVLGLAVEGELAVLAMGDEGIVVLDVAVPEAPREVASLPLGGFVGAVAMKDEIAYVADRWGGLRLIDVAEPERPRVVGTLPTMGWAMDVAVGSETAYVAAGSEGLLIVDTTDPTKPTLTASLPLAGRQASRVVASDGLALVVDTVDGLQIVDVATPASPRAVGTWQPLIEAAGVAVSDDRAYVAAGRAGIRLVDISSPAAPRELDALPTVLPVVSADRLGDQLMFSTVWDPASIEPAAFWEVSAASDQAVTLTAAPPHQVTGRIGQATFPLDELDPDHGETTGSNPVWQAATSGSLLVYAIETGILIVDMSGPAACELAFLQTSPRDREGTANAVALSGSTAYVSIDGLEVVDLSDARRPRLIASVPGVEGHAALVNGKSLYLVGGSTLHVYDVGKPSHPRLLASLELPGRALYQRQVLAMAAGRLFVAAGDGGLVAVDVSDPKRPRLAGRLEVPGRAETVVSDGARLYVGTDETGLVLVEWSTGAPGPLGPSVAPAWSGLVEPIDSPVFGPQDASDRPTPRVGCTVTTTGDAGAGSLRDCLSRIADGEAIEFAPEVFSPTDPGAIYVTTPLEWNATGFTVDGGGGVILDGGGSGTAFTLKGAKQTTIRGLTIRNFETGITLVGVDYTLDANVIEGNVIGANQIDLRIIHASGNFIVGNRIGVDATGTRVTRLPDQQFNDINLEVGSRMNQVIGNTFGTSVYVADPGSSNNAFVGNRFGVDPAGRRLPCQCQLVVIEPFNRIGGSLPGEGNVLAGGLFLGGGNVALGNEIGSSVAPAAQGVDPDNPTVAVAGMGNVLGGRMPGSGNRVTGSVAVSVETGSTANLFVGNSILGERGRPLQIGFAVGGSGNIIAANELVGAQLAGVLLKAESTRNLVAGNRFVSNVVAARDNASNNRWDFDGRGNFWSDYVGRDGDGDGIGDEPRPVPPEGVDRYPLIQASG